MHFAILGQLQMARLSNTSLLDHWMTQDTSKHTDGDLQTMLYMVAKRVVASGDWAIDDVLNEYAFASRPRRNFRNRAYPRGRRSRVPLVPRRQAAAARKHI